MATAATLSNGMKMPLVGLGTWLALNEQEIETAVDEALTAGYRHFDTAYMYTNEKEIGKVLKKWIDSGKIKREELFIVTKLPMIGMSAGKVSHFVKLQLEALQLSYIDLYLIHGPVGFKYINDTELIPKHPDGKVVLDLTTDLEAIWKAMEKEVDAGHLKSLGVSNFNVSQLERIVKIARIPVVNNQVECHVYLQQRELRAACAKHNIVVCAYAPIGSPGRKTLYESRGITFDVESPLEEPVVKELAKKYYKSPAQVLLRFLTQQGVVVIPKSTNPARLKQNFQVLDFQLTPTEMETLERLDRGKEGRTFDYRSFPGCELHPELPF